MLFIPISLHICIQDHRGEVPNLVRLQREVSNLCYCTERVKKLQNKSSLCLCVCVCGFPTNSNSWISVCFSQRPLSLFLPPEFSDCKNSLTELQLLCVWVFLYKQSKKWLFFFPFCCSSSKSVGLVTMYELDPRVLAVWSIVIRQILNTFPQWWHLSGPLLWIIVCFLQFSATITQFFIWCHGKLSG